MKIRIAVVAIVSFACWTRALPAQTNQCSACDSYTDSVGRQLDVEFGERRPVIDAIGWCLGIPDKLYMWDRRAKNHRVSNNTVRKVGDYLTYAGVDDVKVRVNQYDPIGEWDRLVENKRISPGLKYTAGLLRHVRYVILPDRLFGRDEYNPYTNSLYLHSDIPSLGLAESAYAYDVRTRAYPGVYATAQTLPLVAMWHETLATDEVLHYIAIRGNPAEKETVRRELYARYGISLGGELGRVLPNGTEVFQITGALAGHTSAMIQNRNRSTR